MEQSILTGLKFPVNLVILYMILGIFVVNNRKKNLTRTGLKVYK